jgi:hypothetical protein
MILKNKLDIYLPGFITFIILISIVAWTILIHQGNPLELAQLGTIYSENDPDGTEGYDGQFSYYIAIDPNPTTVRPYLDIPAYRYQRILLPVLARWFSLGKPQVIPWMFPIVGILVHTIATIALSSLLKKWNVSPWYALSYSLWAGVTLAIRLDLPEPLAYGCIILAMYYHETKSDIIEALFFCLALFAKEVTILFIFACLFSFFLQKQWRSLAILVIGTVLPFAVFQFWLRHIFGVFGITSGGLYATSFEFIPFMGLFRIGEYSSFYMVMLAIAFLPCTIAPAIWGCITSIKVFLKLGDKFIAIAVILNALLIIFLPFSTFRETGGLLRISSGLILSTLCLAAQIKQIKMLHYSYLWIIYNLFLFK